MSTSPRNRSDYPVAQPYRPPTPSSFRRIAQLSGLLLLAGSCFTIGAFLLPGAQKAPSAPRRTPPAEAVAATVTSPPVVETKRQPVELPKQEAAPAEPAPVVLLPAGGGPLTSAVASDQELDRALASASIPASPLASDAEFLRRAHLDITGQIPTLDKTRAFLDSSDPYKRSKLIDELLASPDYGAHFAHIWSDLLIKRDFDSNKSLKTDAFEKWLAGKFNENSGWDKIVVEMLTAEGKEAEVPPTLFFLANQDNNQPAPSKLVGASANLFMGIQLQCAECHVHPFTAAWSTKDFWGLAAFFGHTRAERELDAKGKGKPGTANIVEVDRKAKLTGKAAKKDNSKPVPPGAMIPIPDPTDPRKTTGTAKAKFFEGPEPALADKGPYRQHFARWITSSRNRYFAPAAVNRMWAHFFARGFVNPVEDMNDDNKPSHPGVLQRLAGEFVASGHDLKFLVRAICNTRAYQRTSKPLPSNALDEKLFSHMAVKVVSADMLLESLAVATGAQSKDKGAGRGRGRNAGNVSTLRFFDTREYDDDPTEFSFGVPQVLRLMNTSLSNSSQEVATRLAKARGNDRPKIIEDIYLTALSRRPTAAEQKKMHDFVARNKDPLKGYAGVFWALLNSAEFVCNH